MKYSTKMNVHFKWVTTEMDQEGKYKYNDHNIEKIYFL